MALLLRPLWTCSATSRKFSRFFRRPRHLCTTASDFDVTSEAKGRKNMRGRGQATEALLSADEYKVFRRQQLKPVKNLYPQGFTITHRINDVLRDYSHLDKGAKSADGVIVTLAGRVHQVRRASKKLCFIDLVSSDGVIQIKASKQDSEDPAFEGMCSTNACFFAIFCLICSIRHSEVLEMIRRGDVIGVTGVPCRTPSGELSVAASKVSLLTPCMRIMPNPNTRLDNTEKRFRRRHVDFLQNPEKKQIFK